MLPAPMCFELAGREVPWHQPTLASENAFPSSGQHGPSLRSSGEGSGLRAPAEARALLAPSQARSGHAHSVFEPQKPHVEVQQVSFRNHTVKRESQ